MSECGQCYALPWSEPHAPAGFGLGENVMAEEDARERRCLNFGHPHELERLTNSCSRRDAERMDAQLFVRRSRYGPRIDAALIDGMSANLTSLRKDGCISSVSSSPADPAGGTTAAGAARGTTAAGVARTGGPPAPAEAGTSSSSSSSSASAEAAGTPPVRGRRLRRRRLFCPARAPVGGGGGAAWTGAATRTGGGAAWCTCPGAPRDAIFFVESGLRFKKAWQELTGTIVIRNAGAPLPTIARTRLDLAI